MTFTRYSESKQRKRPEKSGHHPLLAKISLVNFCLASGRWVGAEASDKLVLVVGSYETLIEVDSIF